ncbi:hypothetical protein BH11BAC6_BH11BAC6_05710 [soil metagenome]
MITYKTGYFKKTIMVFLTWFICLYSYTQCSSKQEFWDKIFEIENSGGDNKEKLQQLIQLKAQFEKCALQRDSVYARMLHKIGAFQYLEGQYNQSIQNTIGALKINTSGKPGACISYAANSYYNLGRCYELGLSKNSQALLFYDSSIIIGKRTTDFKKYIARARLSRGNIYFRKGDFERDVEETTLGLQVAKEIADTTTIINLLLERAQAFEMQQKLPAALNDVNTSLSLLNDPEDYDSWADAYRYKGDILADQQQFTAAIDLYKKAIAFRTKTGNTINIANDYNDAGYLLLDKCNNINEADKYFQKAFKLASGNGENNVAPLVANNIAQISFYKKDYSNALEQYQKTLQLVLPHYNLKDVNINPPYKELIGLESKSFLETVLDNKAKAALYLYKQTNNVSFLKLSISTAQLTDSVITALRHEQRSEQTKLYWRKDTRDFFTRSIEACYLDKNPALALFFLEKSRSVLLNDKLNELGAAANLPAAEATKEESFQINITEQQQKLSALEPGTIEFQNQQNKLLEAKEDFEKYIKSLEQKYPAYYQYKYKDEVPTLKSLQQYLDANHQSFVHYFMGDTVTYILAIMPENIKFMRLSAKDFSSTQLTAFLQMCSDKQALNNEHDKFIALSNTIYKSLFQELQLPKGRVIICADNFLIPFEALSSDAAGKDFLIYNYTFSYAYSANYLLTTFNSYKAKGDFLGVAPVSFSSFPGLPDLKQSAAALNASASGYNNVYLLTEAKANSKNFLQEVTKYTIVNIFSHASADSSDNEPTLFMADSLIHLSQLQLINNPATKLVVLSACETNVGKSATGEGIYSLARGFASAGIPAVSATLWKADEATIYAITALFNHNLASGMKKDEALRQAKISFMQNSDNDKLLPYYWANMVLVGNTEPVQLTEDNHLWWWMAGITVIVILLVVFIVKNRKASADISPVL